MIGILDSMFGYLFYYLFYFVTTSFVCLMLLPVFVLFLSFAIGCSALCYTCVQLSFRPLCVFSVCAPTYLSHDLLFHCENPVFTLVLFLFLSLKLLFIVLLTFGIFGLLFCRSSFVTRSFFPTNSFLFAFGSNSSSNVAVADCAFETFPYCCTVFTCLSPL